MYADGCHFHFCQINAAQIAKFKSKMILLRKNVVKENACKLKLPFFGLLVYLFIKNGITCSFLHKVMSHANLYRV